MNIRFNSLLLALLFVMPLGASMIQNDIPSVGFYAAFSEGSGSTPAFSGTGGSGTMSCTDLSWNAGPPVAASANGTTTICSATPGTGVNLNSSTLSACINPTTWGESNAGYVVHSDADGTLNGRAVNMYIQSANTNVGSFVEAGAATRIFDANNSVTVGDATWKHIVVANSNCGTIQNCSVRIWVNGVEKTVTPSGTGTGTKNADTNIRVMNRVDGARAWDGLMRDVRLYTSAFNKFQAEFISNNANCAGSSTPSPAITETDCDALMQSYLAAQGLTADPFERSAGGFQNGDGCAVFAQVPTR